MYRRVYELLKALRCLERLRRYHKDPNDEHRFSPFHLVKGQKGMVSFCILSLSLSTRKA